MAKKKPRDVVMPSPNRRITMKVDDKTQTIYANNVGVEASNWDLKIRFGLVQDTSPDVVNVLDIAHVYMTHEHAKAMVAAMSETLNKLDVVKAQLAAVVAKIQ